MIKVVEQAVRNALVPLKIKLEQLGYHLEDEEVQHIIKVTFRQLELMGVKKDG